LTGAKHILTSTLEINVLHTITQKHQDGQSGGLSAKTRLLAGLGGRKAPFLRVFTLF
jgi:hypothetical protein